MRKNAIWVSVLLILSCALSGCVGLPYVGTGQRFMPATNPEPEKMALVYFYRKDGAFAKSIIDIPVLKTSPGSVERYPVIILGDKMYRPMLFEPGEVTFLVRGGGDETVVLKAGETRCVEVARSFRGVAIIGVNEIPLDECLKEMEGLELATTITQLRRLNGATPLLQPRFKDLELGTAIPSQLDKNTGKN